MKLAEALNRRADLVHRFGELQDRAVAAAHYQEGDEPVELPTELAAEADDCARELQELIERINVTNLATEVEPGQTVTAALARRDVLRSRHKLRVALANSGRPRGFRFTRSEIRAVSAVDVRAMRREADELAVELRALDTRLQEVNWTTELID